MSTATLTRESILAMEAGAEMDALVAERVMGWRTHNRNTAWWVDAEVEVGLVPSGGVRGLTSGIDRWSPSTDIAAAFEVVKKLQPDKAFSIVCQLPGKAVGGGDCMSCCAAFGFIEDEENQAETTTYEPALAICRAALLATLESSPC